MRFTVFVTAIVMATMASAGSVEFDGTPMAPKPAVKPDMLEDWAKEKKIRRGLV